ncbi:MAG: hypothetical protein WA775_14495 [Psychroserpens sp.]|uniref:hypothetical protein n=1 Tax=Psychroserpens sp. TaxID=2020870 RepID=UPI003C78050E
MSKNIEWNNVKDAAMKYFGQVFLIVFSVVLGLYLSENIEDKKNERDAQKLLAKINLELNSNKKLLDYWVPYHKEIIIKLDSLSSDKDFINNFINDKSSIFIAFSRGTIMSDIPASDAWDIAKSHPLIVNIDYDKLLILSKIYNQQKFTYGSISVIFDFMISPEFNSSDQAKQNLQLFRDKLNEVHGRELQLLNYYKQMEKFQND